MKCNVCNSKLIFIFTKKVLYKYDVDYFQCSNCQFIQTQSPYWLKETYKNNTLGVLDVGAVNRNVLMVEISERIINALFPSASKFLDFGGGTGLFVRMMRDKGYNFYRQDKYSENIFAKYFDINDLKDFTKFDLLTAFEVFEHFENPIDEINNMLLLSDSLLFSTELQPENNIEDWWYFVAEEGEHISFYSIETLREISNRLNCFFFTDGSSIHFLTKRRFPIDNKKFKRILFPLRIVVYRKLIEKLFLCKHRRQKRQSLIKKDFNYIKSKLNSSNQ
ncbi:MAG: class I SAM-dependent methyltransferase [Thermodesulfobacteriota bacterium]